MKFPIVENNKIEITRNKLLEFDIDKIFIDDKFCNKFESRITLYPIQLLYLYLLVYDFDAKYYRTVFLNRVKTDYSGKKLSSHKLPIAATLKSFNENFNQPSPIITETSSTKEVIEIINLDPIVLSTTPTMIPMKPTILVSPTIPETQSVSTNQHHPPTGEITAPRVLATSPPEYPNNHTHNSYIFQPQNLNGHPANTALKTNNHTYETLNNTDSQQSITTYYQICQILLLELLQFSQV